MTADPKLHINGPKVQGGQPTGDQVDLYLVEDSTVEAETDTNERSIPGQDDDESVLAGLAGKRNARYQGIGNGLRLMYAGIGSDPVDALITWLIDLESLVQSNQGVGYEVEDDMREETIGPTQSSPGLLFDTVRWSQEGGSPTVVDWTLEGQVSDGVQQATNRSQYVTRENNRRDPTITTDSIETPTTSFNLGYVEERSYEREIDLNTLGLVHQYDVPNVGISESGVQGTFSVNGYITERDVPDLALVSRQINNVLHGVEVTINDAFTKRTWTGMVSDSDSSFAAGDPGRIEYRIEVTIGAEVTQRNQ